LARSRDDDAAFTQNEVSSKSKKLLREINIEKPKISISWKKIIREERLIFAFPPLASYRHPTTPKSSHKEHLSWLVIVLPSFPISFNPT
jgi:hypothetical protein